jgi:hypothetical protein
MFQRNMSPPSSGSKNKPSKKLERKQVANSARRYAPPLTFNGLRGLKPQKTDLLINTYLMSNTILLAVMPCSLIDEHSSTLLFRKQGLALSVGPNWVGFYLKTETESSPISLRFK